MSGRILEIGDTDQVPALTEFISCIDIISQEEIDNLSIKSGNKVPIRAILGDRQ